MSHVPENSMARCWRVQLSGDFGLRDPDGNMVRLGDRKVEGLIAILALSRDFGVERQTLANLLWPGRASVNLANLRQALSTLRRFLGSDAVEANRSICRLSSSFLLEIESARGVFMPGHEGEWFDDVRLGDAEPMDEPASAVAHFYQALKWFAKSDRRGLHSLLTASVSMARGIGYAELLDLLNAAPEDPTCVGWSMFWHGTAENDLETCAALLRSALREARRTDDLHLASEVCYELGKVYSRSGKLEKAIRICDIADRVAQDSQSKTSLANAMRLRGTVLTHWQDQDASLKLLRRAEDHIDAPLDRASALTTRAFYEASARVDDAHQTLESSIALSRDLGHYGISIVSQFTHRFLRLDEKTRDENIADFSSLARHCYSIGLTQFGVYSEEALATLIRLEGDEPRARQHLASAHRARQSSQMVVTQLEAQRLRHIG